MYMPLVSLPSHMQAWDVPIYNTDKYHKNIKVGYESHDMRIVGAMCQWHMFSADRSGA